MRFIANDGTALSVDVGYNLQFEADILTGRPSGCPIFDGQVDPAGSANASSVVQYYLLFSTTRL